MSESRQMWMSHVHVNEVWHIWFGARWGRRSIVITREDSTSSHRHQRGFFFIYEERGITFIALIDREELLSSSMETNHMWHDSLICAMSPWSRTTIIMNREESPSSHSSQAESPWFLSCDYTREESPPMNESCHIWMSNVKYEWVMSHMSESWHIWVSHVTYEWVMPNTTFITIITSGITLVTWLIHRRWFLSCIITREEWPSSH